MTGHVMVRQPATVSPVPVARLQRKCATSCRCDRCTKERTRHAGHDEAGAAAVPAIVRQVLDSPGHPLDAASRRMMERRFGHDFGRVRIHADGKADASARAVNASAYEVGQHIVFAGGQYEPATRSGAMMLAHELTHVLQQPAYANSAELHLAEGADAHEREADALAARVMGGGATASAMSGISAVGSAPPGRVMRKMGPELEPPSAKQSAPEVCEMLPGPRQQPDFVSQTLIDRWKGKYASEGDQGEGCIEHPYVAGVGETVCTIGYGHQIPGCPVVNKATSTAPTAEERKTAAVSDLACGCDQKFDCKGSQAEEQLKKDARVGVNYVHQKVAWDLDQAQFDALVDLTLHHGSIPQTLLDAIQKYWCTPEGKNYVRDLYLKTALTRQGSKKIERGFVSRREHRVWPVAS